MVHHFGAEKWDLVKVRSGVDVDYFISNEPYDDDITFKLATAVSEEMNMSIDSVLHAFGEWWVLKTGQEKYGGLMKAGGDSLKEFLAHLPLFHNRVMLIYPKLTPPEFRVSNITDNSVEVSYYSKRTGLREFVRGLLLGLGKLYQTKVAVELICSRDEGQDHDTFVVRW